MKRPKAKPARYSTIRSSHIGRPSVAVIDGGEDDAGGVAGDAVDGRADALLPQRLDELLMLAGARLLVGQHVEQQPDRPHVERDEDEAPLHHHGLGVVAVLIDADIERRGDRQREPDHEEIVDRLDEHWLVDRLWGLGGALRRPGLQRAHSWNADQSALKIHELGPPARRPGAPVGVRHAAALLGHVRYQLALGFYFAVLARHSFRRISSGRPCSASRRRRRGLSPGCIWSSSSWAGRMAAVGVLAAALAWRLSRGQASHWRELALLGGAGALSVGTMSAVNFVLGSDFRWLLILPVVAWARRRRPGRAQPPAGPHRWETRTWALPETGPPIATRR